MTLFLYKHTTSKPDDIETNIMAANISTRFFLSCCCQGFVVIEQKC